ncbi:MAG: protein kinase [Leptolyngbyaceae cyanobacterium RU_5_1]|nr:protein kinase [Leptolyngbyaceae cyanobacterium RU_5_1]
MSNLVSHITVNYPELNKPLDGRYQVVEILTARLWGRTYLAQDLRRPSQSECIIHHMKAIPAIPNYTDVARCLFAREAAMLEEFGTHAQIPELLACFEDNYGFYVVQEFIVGHPLDAELQPGMRWSPEQVIGLLQEALEPLAFIHRYGCVHGNLKPDNLLRRMSDSRLVLINVGSMRQIQLSFLVADGQPIPPNEGAQQGYQPIEQVQGFLCPASDVYALGMIAVQALTGIHPTQFQVDLDAGEILWQSHCPSSTFGLQQELIDLVNGMVEWDLTQRFATAGEVLDALQDLLSAIAPIDGMPTPSIPTAIANPPTFIATNSKVVESFKDPLATAANGATGVESPDVEAFDAIAPEPSLATNGSAAVEPPAFSEPITTPPTPALQNGSASVKPRPTPMKPISDAKSRFQLNRLLIGAISKPSVRIGVGGTVLSIVFALMGWNLLTSLNWVEASNQIWEKVNQKLQKKQQAQANGQASSRAAGSVAPRTARMVITKLTTEWSTAATVVQQAEQALNQGKWAEVRQLTQDLPKIPYWERRGAAVSQQANGKAETEANQLLQTAYDHARSRHFTEAIAVLKRVPADVPAAAIAQAKIQEYTQEQAIKAQSDLQKAYDRAIVREFTAALDYLRKIPTGTPAYAIAQQKVLEYTQKQKIRAQVLLRAANEKAANQDFLAALTSLEKVSQGSHLDPKVEVKIAEYTDRLNQQANQWLQKANQQANLGDMSGALASLEKVAIGTPAYAQARDKIAEYSNSPDRQLNNETIAMQDTNALQDLNPGNYLREVMPFTAGRTQNVK